MIKLHQKSVYRDKSKRYKTFNAEINESNDNDFFSEFKKKKKSVMKSLLCLRRLLIKCLNLNKLQTLNSSHT